MNKSDNEAFDELKEIVETSERLHKNLKSGVLNNFKKILLMFAPLSLLLLKNIMPVSFFPYFSLICCVSSVILTTVFAVKEFLKDAKTVKKEIERDIDKLNNIDINKGKKNSITKGNNRKQLSNNVDVKKKSIITNQLSNCIDLQYFGEYIQAIFTFLCERGKNKIESLDEDIIEQYIGPIQNILGDNVKVISTLDLEADIIAKMYNKKAPIKAISYLYDGENFYVYRPDKNAITLLPIRKVDMYNVFTSNDNNYNNTSLNQFFSEIYGDISDNKKSK